MYALKARDKLHKMEKEREKEIAKGAESRSREVDRHHRGDKKQPATSKREAKVSLIRGVCVSKLNYDDVKLNILVLLV